MFQAHEVVLVQAFRPELAVEGLDERIVRRLSRPQEVKRHSFHVCPQIELARDKLAALIDPDRRGIADLGADSFQHVDHIWDAEAEPWNDRWRVPTEGVDDSQDTQLDASK